METSRHNFTDPADLSGLHSQIDYVGISTQTPPLFQVSLGRNVAGVIAWPTSPAVRGTAEQIRQIVARRRRWLAWIGHDFARGAVIVALFTVLLPAVAAIIIGYLWHNSAALIWGLVGLGLFVTVGGANWIEGHRGRIMVIPERLGQTPNFWIRNRDTLIISAIVAVVGAVIGALVTKALS